jgi:hypothetical protein
MEPKITREVKGGGQVIIEHKSKGKTLRHEAIKGDNKDKEGAVEILKDDPRYKEKEDKEK